MWEEERGEGHGLDCGGGGGYSSRRCGLTDGGAGASAARGFPPQLAWLKIM